MHTHSPLGLPSSELIDIPVSLKGLYFPGNLLYDTHQDWISSLKNYMNALRDQASIEAAFNALDHKHHDEDFQTLREEEEKKLNIEILYDLMEEKKVLLESRKRTL